MGRPRKLVRDTEMTIDFEGDMAHMVAAAYANAAIAVAQAMAQVAQVEANVEQLLKQIESNAQSQLLGQQTSLPLLNRRIANGSGQPPQG